MYEIKIGYLLAYDYEMMKISLPLVYQYADKIVLSLDKNRKTYKGNSFEIPTAFFNWLKQIDTKNIITVYEDDFAKPDLSPMECEVRQRRMTAGQLGTGGWHLQIDVDEYFVDFGKFIAQLRRFEKMLKPNEYVTVFANWITLFKQINEGYLYTIFNKGYELCHIATNNPDYEYGRACKNQNALLADNFILHDSWARDENQLKLKLKNWSHSNDFDSDQFFSFWQSINVKNYHTFTNFHPLNSSLWKSLALLKGKTIPEILSDANLQLESKIKPWKTALRNMKGGGKILSLLKLNS
ncbi:MAG: hypothetical protein HQ463_00230 [Bacteroidetes bacterium]|nr:hypothetical protein [Bacteroidota bacterium]